MDAGVEELYNASEEMELSWNDIYNHRLAYLRESRSQGNV